MISRFYKLIAISSLFVIQPVVASKASEIQVGAIESKTPGGLPFIHQPMKKAKRLAVHITWEADLGLAPKGREGVPFIAKQLMMVGGADGKSSRELKSAMGDLGGTFQILVRPDKLGVVITSRIDRAIDVAKIANNVLIRPNLGEEWLNRIKDDYLQFMRQAQARPMNKALVAARLYSLGDHEFGRVAPFYPKGVIADINFEDIVNWRRNAFVRTGVKIVTAGNGEIARIGEVVDALLRDMPESPVSKVKKSSVISPRYDGKTILLVDKETQKSAIMMFAQVPLTVDERDILTYLSVQILGGGTNSHLFRKLRGSLGLTYGVQAKLVTMQNKANIVMIKGEFETAKIAQAAGALREAYAAFQQGGVSEQDLEAEKERQTLENNKRMSVPAIVSNVIMNGLLTGRKLNFEKDYETLVNNIQTGRINNHIAAEFPGVSKVLMVIVTPNSDGIKADCVIQAIEEVKKCTGA